MENYECSFKFSYSLYSISDQQDFAKRDPGSSRFAQKIVLNSECNKLSWTQNIAIKNN